MKEWLEYAQLLNFLLAPITWGMVKVVRILTTLTVEMKAHKELDDTRFAELHRDIERLDR